MFNILTLISVLVLTSTSQAQQSFNDFLNYFGSNCSIRGEHSREAIQSVRVLINTLEQIRDDENCKPLTQVVSELQIVEKNLAYYNSDANLNQRTYSALENRRLEILTLLSQTTSAAEREVLLAELRNTQLSLAENYSYASTENNYNSRNHKQTVLSDALSATNSVFSAIQNSQSCWLKHPSLLDQASGVATALGQSYSLGVASMTSIPYVSAAIQLGAMVVSHVRNLKYNRKIKDFRKTVEPTAIYCSIETMTNQYCSAKDTVTSVKMVLKAFEETNENNPLSALLLIDREVSTLTQWLEEVRAGSPAQNSGYANTRADLRSKESQLLQSADRAQGIIADYKKRMAQISDPDPRVLLNKKWQIQKQVILEITNSIFGSCFSPDQGCISNNPLALIYDSINTASYHLVGNTSPARDNVGNVKDFRNSFDPFGSDWNGNGPFNPNIEIVEQRFSEWYQQANDNFIIQKNLVIQDDPFLPFSKAIPKTITGNFKGLSVRGSLDTLIAFLIKNSDKKTINLALNIIYDDTKDRLIEISKTIDAVISGELDPNEALSIVSTAANLNNGTSYLQSRLNLFIRTIVEEYVLEETADNERLVLLSSFDSLQALKRISGSQSINSILNDAKNSQQILQGAILELSDLFKKEIKTSIDQYDKMSRLTQEKSLDAPNNYMKTLFCFNLISLPEIPGSSDIRSCLGLKLNSPFTNGPDAITFTPELLAKSFLDRACLYRDFRRKNDVHQSLIESRVLFR